MLTSLKLSTGTLGFAVKIRVMPAGKDIVRSPVIFTRQLGKDETPQQSAQEQRKRRICGICIERSIMLTDCAVHL